MPDQIKTDFPSATCAVAGFLTAAVGSLVTAGLFATWYGFGSVLHVLLLVLVGYMLAMHCTRNGGDLFGMISFLYLPQDAETAPNRLEREPEAPALDHMVVEEVPEVLRDDRVAASAGTPTSMERESEGSSPPPRSGVDEERADDLKRLHGVGPKLESMLNEMGVYHLDQIAEWTEAELARVDSQLGSFKGRAVRDDWIGQARQLTRSS